MSKSKTEVLKSLADPEKYKELHWTGTFDDYLEIVKSDPTVARTSFQRLYSMILSHGTSKYIDAKKEVTRYKFFDDPYSDGKDAVFGIDVHLMKLVDVIGSSAKKYGAEKRIMLLHGPVGSSKSTIARLFKRGLEAYSRTDEGRLYSFVFVNEDGTEVGCPMNEEPLKLIPQRIRKKFLSELGIKVDVDGTLCPSCRWTYKELAKKYEGDLDKILSHVRVKRLVLSEEDRIGIGTFQPKDEKSQDATELTGDINYRKLAEIGVDSDPRAFSFDGEFCVANRGMIEFIEVLKLETAFLYDLLCATQEHTIKPKKFPQTDIDEVILGHTNEAEYKKLVNDEFMEALRDRTIKVDIPYVSKLDNEIKIYAKDYNTKKIKEQHIAPHTLEIASMWAILTRLEEPKKVNLTLMQKLKLYNGKSLPGFTEDNIKELRKEADREGMDGISPRYVQDRISSAMIKNSKEQCLNPFMVLGELEHGLKHHPLIRDEELIKHYKELIEVVKKEYEDIVKTEVQKAICADESALERICANYIDNVRAYTQREKVKNKFTGQDEPPDEKLMRSIEEKIDVPDSRKDDFRREIISYIGALAIEGKKFKYDANERLLKAFQKKLFEDSKDSIKLSSIVSNVVDEDTQKKIEIVKQRLIKNYGYCETCAGDVLNFVSSLMARGDLAEDR